MINIIVGIVAIGLLVGGLYLVGQATFVIENKIKKRSKAKVKPKTIEEWEVVIKESISSVCYAFGDAIFAGLLVCFFSGIAIGVCAIIGHVVTHHIF